MTIGSFGSLEQAVKQMYVLVFGLDVIGNPFGVVRGLAVGIEDFFYEPYSVRLSPNPGIKLKIIILILNYYYQRLFL